MSQEHFISELSKLRPSSTFLALLGYRNAYNEVADYSLVFHFSYERALQKSITLLEDMSVSEPLAVVAKAELLDGYQKSLAKVRETAIEDLDDAYERFFDSEGKYIKGIKRHRETNILHLYGLVNSKRVLLPGVYPAASKKALTVAKDNLRKGLPVNRFRQFILTPNHVNQISVEGLHLLPPA